MIINVLTSIGYYVGIDILLEYFKFEGRYYFNHMICNSVVVYNTFNSMINCYNLTNMITTNELNNLYIAKYAVYGLHIYHILWYYKKLRRDDWIHHILMIGLVLPLTDLMPQHNIFSHGLFFTTGLPGLIDYTLLFLNRNNVINRITEKNVNSFLNVWIRGPGCIMNTCMGICIISMNYNTFTLYQLYSSIIMGSLLYWNGIYFMKQTLLDYNNSRFLNAGYNNVYITRSSA